MSDFFFSKLPQGHAIRSIAKPAATTSIRAEAMVTAAPDSNVDRLRRQCAAVVWVSSDVYSVDAVEKLAAADRTYLLKLFGLSAGGGSKAQAQRIDAHVKLHRPGADSHPSANNGGGAGASGGVDGGGGGGAPGVGPDGLAGALLTPAQAATLDKIPRAALVALLSAAGMPLDAGDTLGVLRSKCATATWAGERLRQPYDVHALPAAVASRVVEAFGIPSGWKAEARDRALDSLLQACRDSPWAVDPSTSHGLISADRSAIFRVAEQLQARRQAPATQRADHFLSATDQADMATILALTGNSLADIECVGGRWQVKSGDGGSGLGGAGAARSSPSASETAAQLALEAQIRTLRVETYPLLTADERKDQANRSKATPGRKRAPAFPGDTAVDAEEVSFNPFAEWPYEQSLMFEASYSYSLCGRMLRNALRWCNRNFTDGLARVTWRSQQTTTSELYTSFSEAVAAQRHDQALLLASQAVAEATSQMTAIVADAKLNATRFPHSKMLLHIASRREAQALQLKVFLADIAQRVTEASKKKTRPAAALATASWIDFLDGWLATTDKSLVSAESLQLASAVEDGATPNAPGASVVSGSASSSGSPSAKAARTASASSPGSGGGSPASAAATTPPGGKTPLRKICVFQQNIPCSPEIVGDTLGVPGAPFCTKCRKGQHYYGECPTEWGRLSRALPGFADDGSRIDNAWCQNEPIKSVVKAWTKFLQDKSNFNNNVPAVAGVSGAPSLADFQARIAGAPAKK